MVQAWYLKENITNPREPNHTDPAEYISMDELKKNTGILYWRVDADRYEEEGLLKKIREERGYSYLDEIYISPEKLPDYEAKLKIFYQEHLHADEEIRFILDGEGYFDVRDTNDRWIRIQVVKNDLIVLPPGIYHRFTLGVKDYCHVKRLNVDQPVWHAIPRPADEHPARVTYLEMAKNGFVAA